MGAEWEITSCIGLGLAYALSSPILSGYSWEAGTDGSKAVTPALPQAPLWLPCPAPLCVPTHRHALPQLIGVCTVVQLSLVVSLAVGAELGLVAAAPSAQPAQLAGDVALQGGWAGT